MVSRPFRHIRRHIIGYIALFVALGGVGYAAIPDSNGVIHGCYDTSAQVNGASPLYVIDTSSTSSCPAGRSGQMTALNWLASAQQIGPQGPQGPQGPPGPTGPAGKPGDNGTTGHFSDPGDLVKPGKTKTVRTDVLCNVVAESLNGPWDCTKAAAVRCPTTHPTAEDGGWAIYAPPSSPFSQQPYTGKPGDYTDQTAFAFAHGKVAELYNLRLPSKRAGGTEGWAASISVKDTGIFVNLGFGSGNVPALENWKLHVWAVCAPKPEAKVLGVPLVPPIH